MNVTTTGADETIERLQAIAERLKNLQPVLDVIAQDTRTLIDDSFHRSVSPSGPAWARLSEATESINERRRGGKPLVDTGRLRNSITASATNNKVAFGTNTKYAGPHQLGAQIRLFGRGKKRQLKSRPFLPVTKNGSRFSLMTSGQAGRHWIESRAMIAKYIRAGIID